jgi:plasmid stability protein
MLERERYWIQELKTFCNDPLHHGYNMTLGGEGVFGLVRTKEQRQHLSFIHKRENLTEETIRRMSNAAKNRVPSSQETRKKISEALKGENNPCYGKSWGRSGPLREETKQKISESRKGKKLSEEHKQKLSHALSGENHPLYGKPCSEERKEKIRNSNLLLFYLIYTKIFITCCI